MDADYVFVEFVAVCFRGSVGVAGPVCNLATVFALIVVAFNVLCMLALGRYTVFGVLHERREISHRVKPSEVVCEVYPKIVYTLNKGGGGHSEQGRYLSLTAFYRG